MMRPLASPTAAPAAIPADHAGGDPGLQHHHGGDAARERRGRADREIEAAADDDEGHAHGDHRHDRGLHQDVGEIERREKAVGQQRGHHAQHDQRDQRHLAGEVEAVQLDHHPPIAARSCGSSRPCAALERPAIRPCRTASTLSHSARELGEIARVDQHAAAAGDEIADQRVDLRLGGDVDALASARRAAARRRARASHFARITFC